MTTQITHFIYVLAEIKGTVFYCGRTNDMERRLKEHRRDAIIGNEAKYQYIRDLYEQGKDFEMILLAEVNQESEHYEDFYVYSLIMDGFELTNMKQGDSRFAAQQDAMLEMKNRGERFIHPQEFLDAREIEIKQYYARKQAEKLRDKILNKEKKRQDYINSSYYDETTVFIGENPHKKVSAGLQSILNKRSKK